MYDIKIDYVETIDVEMNVQVTSYIVTGRGYVQPYYMIKVDDEIMVLYNSLSKVFHFFNSGDGNAIYQMDIKGDEKRAVHFLKQKMKENYEQGA